MLKMLEVFLLICLTGNILVDSLPLDDSVIEGHVVGGNDTDISKVPYQVAMYYNKRYRCGGFIVSPTFIVSAGHCVHGIRDANIAFRAGSSSMEEGGVVINVKTVFRHPNYNDRTTDYDVAVLELETPLQFNNKTIKPIKLTTKEPAAGSLVLVSGWGAVNEHFDEPETLQSGMYPIYDRKKCTEIYALRKTKITPRMICAGAEGKTAYFGDSGGPIVYNGEVVGIVSFGDGCGQKDLPGVYTNIADPEITQFIKENAKL